MPSNEELTVLLQQWSGGDRLALDRLVEPAYKELNKLAQKVLSIRGNPSVSPGTLVHEAYMRLRRSAPANCQNRVHFYALAARLMRYILVDHVRARSAAKRFAEPVTLLEPGAESSGSEDAQLAVIDVDTALNQLAQLDEMKARIVELRYFSGLSLQETAEATGLSLATVKRNWVFAKTWIRKWLSEQAPAR